MASPNGWRLPRLLEGLLFSIGAWCVIGALFFLLRSYGTGEVFDWMTGPGSVLLMILVVGLLLGGLDWAGSSLIDHSRLRSRPFWVLLVLKSASLTIALFIVIFLARLVAVASGQIPLSELPTAYLSDVLNTAARIQSQCNEIGRSLLLSGALRDRLEPAGLFSFRAEGEIVLRGREEMVALFSVVE